MAELLKLLSFTKQFGLFRNSQLDTPTVYPIARLQLPRRAILHYVTTDGVVMGPQASDPLIRNVPGVTYLDHVVKYHNPIGKPTPKPNSNPNNLIAEYRKRNRLFRPLRNLDRIETDDRTLVVFNYSLLSHMVKYASSFRIGYYQWYNVYQEVMENANYLAGLSNRSQFIEIDLPEIIPALSTLREFNSSLSIQSMKRLRTDEEKMIAHLFLWAGKSRSQSLFGRIDPKHYQKINLLVRRLNSWVVINLGWLDSFRKDETVGRSKGMDVSLYELKVLHLFTKIHQATSPIRTQTSDEIKADHEVSEDTIETQEEVSEHDLDQDEEDFIASEELLDHEQEVAKLEKELEELDRIKEESSEDYEVTDEDGNIVEAKAAITGDASINIGVTPKEGEAVVVKANELASKGLLSGAEYRRLIRVSETFNNLPDPYGIEGSVTEALKIDEKDILIEPPVLTNDDVVTDRSLAYSRVDVMERQYIDKVLRKDILRCVSAMQRAPVAITDYRIERETDAVNDREIHVVKFVPAVGSPSTIRFPVPVVKSDGSFLYNNNRYAMRKQRADLPLRKISPTRVALSSYYAKVFAERTQRTRFNYNRWFLNHLVLKCLDREDPYISDSVLSNAVDYKAPVPLMYSTIATRISSFKVGKLEFSFDYKHRIDKFRYTEDILKHEKNGWTLVGKGPKGPLIMDDGGGVYVINNGSVEEVGPIEDLVGIDTDKAPTSMVEVKIYSKNIPIGIALAYLLGMDNLLKIIKAKHRRVLVGEKLNLDKDEYAIRFKDESIILNRNDALSTLIMSGFNLYHAHIRNYGSALFNEKDVYAAVLERAGIGGRYLRELDMMNTLFIDPITEDLLKWMKEPTTFTGLLVRSVEMLLNEQVQSRRVDKDNLVESLERVRGYERVAGTVYEVLSRAIRNYSARAAGGRASITLNPNEAMTAIIQDPTTSPVNNINPIHSLREREVITFGGRGGRNRRAMVASARLFTDEDMGFVSEGTVDSGDVAIITYLSPNSNLTSVRGTVRMYDAKRDGASCIMSTSALLSPCADGDK